MSNIKKHTKGQKIIAKKGVKIGIVVGEYNSEITDVLKESCLNELKKAGVLEKNIKIMFAPGAFELPYMCQQMSKAKKYHAVIALGAVIRGETPHFDFIAFNAAYGIMNISIKYDIPVIFGVLTTENIRQAKARIKKGRRGDKGVEAAQTALKVINYANLKI